MSPNTRTRRELGCLANSPALRLPRVGSRFFKVPARIELDRSRLGGDAAWKPDVGLDPGFERLRPFRVSVDHLLFRFPIAIGREAVTLANVSSVGER